MSQPNYALEILFEGYIVRWAGVDPENGEEWKPSFLSREHCSPELISRWEASKEKAASESRQQSSKLFRMCLGSRCLTALDFSCKAVSVKQEAQDNDIKSDVDMLTPNKPPPKSQAVTSDYRQRNTPSVGKSVKVEMLDSKLGIEHARPLKRQRSYMGQQLSLSSLPKEMTVTIFRELPARDLLRCKQVG